MADENTSVKGRKPGGDMSNRDEETKKANALSGNKGEWSEPYVVLKLAADGVLFQADANMLPSVDKFARVVRIEREDLSVVLDGSGSATFNYKDERNQEHTVFIPSGGTADKAGRLLKGITGIARGEGSFCLPDIANELEFLGFRQLKNPVPPNQRFIKRDLSLCLEDPNTGVVPRLGFSVKSELGSAPTLLNASEATNVVFRLYGMTDRAMDSINSIDTGRKIQDRCKAIRDICSEIRFDHYENRVFLNNLRLIDGDLPVMIAEALSEHYFGGAQTFKEVVAALGSKSRYADCDSVYCSVKIKRFLRACALGLMPSEPWKDHDDATGGYVIVLPSGDIIGFYIYNRSLFDQYLLDSTKFEHGSTSRHRYMTVFKSVDRYYVKLNLQIRFTK